MATADRSHGDIWIYDLPRGIRTRFTFDPALENHASSRRMGAPSRFTSIAPPAHPLVTNSVRSSKRGRAQPSRSKGA
jgi:hypothetical protein